MVFEGLSHSRITSGTTPGARQIIAGAIPDEPSDDRPTLFFVKRDLFAEGHGLGVPRETGKRIGAKFRIFLIEALCVRSAIHSARFSEHRHRILQRDLKGLSRSCLSRIPGPNSDSMNAAGALQVIF